MQPERDDRRDRVLLARLAAGDSEALAELYDRHAASLYRHACALAGRGGGADDLVQAMFVKLATIGAPLLGVRKPASYLHRIVSTLWIDELRSRTLRGEQPLDSPIASRVHAAPRGPSPETRVDVEHALMRLPAVQREVLTLHAIVGFSLRETGQITGVSTFTAASRYRLALARMKKLLRGG